MSTFSEAIGVVLYPFAVVAFATFLVWCFLPLFRQGARFRKSRVFAGLFFLLGPYIPILKIIPLFPFLAFGNAGIAVALFPATFPKYIANLHAWLHEDAEVQEIEYVLEIHGRRYALRIEIACSSRRVVTLNKGIGELRSWTRPAIGNKFFSVRLAAIW